jgi:hypothetical protein
VNMGVRDGEFRKFLLEVEGVLDLVEGFDGYGGEYFGEEFG